MKKSIAVDLIDDDGAVLDALGLYLERRGMRVTRYGLATDYIAAEKRGEPADCIVADIRMSGMSGIELQRWLAKKGSILPLILITGYADVGTAVTAMKAGAFDFLEKPVNEQQLVSSIKKAANLAERKQEQREEIEAITARLATLSKREREVMGHAANGLTSREIGAELGISPRTVEIHRASVMEKLGCETMAEMIRKAIIVELAGRAPDAPDAAT